MRLFGAITLLFCINAVLSAQQVQLPAPEITFTVSMPQPHTHLFSVMVRVQRPTGPTPTAETLVMPVWTPGSYLIREFQRHVQDFAATGAGGNPLPWTKKDKNSWVVATSGARDWQATYRVYANELSVRTSELNSDHAFWNNANLLMYVGGAVAAPATLRIVPRPGWQIATGLPAVAGEANSFHADNFDILYDSPVEVSNFKVISFTVRNVPHRIVIDGEGNYDPERVRNDVQKIVETEVAIMGGEIPYHDYTFILHLRSNGDGGLEHANSVALGYPSFGFQSPNAQSGSTYKDFHSLVAHEFFHLWNVKRIRPDALGPFDYSKENYTKLLWVAEGFTEYYAGIALRRAGLVSSREFLENQAKAFQDLQETPGRLVQSVDESSFDAWIKFYRQDENSINSQVSYYDKGAILGLLLDLEIRKRSHGTKSLDDLMRYLFNEFYKKNRNYSPEDFQKASELMAGSSLEPFFAGYVRGRTELDYDGALSVAGLKLETVGRANPPDEVLPEPFIGAALEQRGERLMVSAVISGSPAYEQGLNTGDQIVAWDGNRATKAFVFARLAEKKPGDVVHLTIFRFDTLRPIDIKLGSRIAASYRIDPVAQPTDEQKKIYEAWLGEPMQPK